MAPQPAGTQNHLGGQTAAYLVQHAEDPTDWYPWGPEAFARARSLDRPILLSIGYSSCHWCHVMQRESFRDGETAAFLNEHFVPIKVDREQRPDIDHLFQQYVALAGGGGGWPLNVFLTPDLRPFYGATFLPRHGSYAMQSFPAVLVGVSRLFAEQRDNVEDVAEEAVTVLEDLQEPKPAPPLRIEDVTRIAEGILGKEDEVHGGLGTAPKFPQWPVIGFLFAVNEALGEKRALTAARRWIEGILTGGVYDQVGGGVFRYATDEAWLVPHFEKMLSDNAMLLSVLSRLYRVSPTEEIARAVRGTATFLARDLAREGGGFWSSLDAETGGVEGATYVWSYEELKRALTVEELTLAKDMLGATPEGNWRAGANILSRRGERGSSSREGARVDAVLSKLARVRAERPQPRTIENAPTDWNALAARGLIEAGATLRDSGLVRQGRTVLDWLLAEARRPDGAGFVHLIGDSEVHAPRQLADEAAVAAACLAAADAGLGDGYRAWASELVEGALAAFGDDVLHMTADETALPVRPVAYDDVPVPSGMSTLIGLYRRLHPDDRFGFDQLFAPLRTFVEHSPLAAGEALALATLVARE